MFGTYRAIAYNYDTETILYRNMSSWQTLEAYTRYSSIEEGAQIATRDAMPRASGAENEPVILEPDPLWAGAGEPVKVIDGESATTTVVPSSRVKTVEIDIYHVPNLQYTSQLGGALTGLAPGVKVATGEPAGGQRDAVVHLPSHRRHHSAHEPSISSDTVHTMLKASTTSTCSPSMPCWQMAANGTTPWMSQRTYTTLRRRTKKNRRSISPSTSTKVCPSPNPSSTAPDSSPPSMAGKG